MSDFERAINTFNSDRIIDYAEKDELKDSLYETLNFKDKVHIAQRHLNEYLKQHKLLNFIFILPIKIQMVLLSILIWSLPTIITMIILFVINHFNPGFISGIIEFMTNDETHYTIFKEISIMGGFTLIMVNMIIVLFVTIWNSSVFLGIGDRAFKNNNLYTLKGLKYVLVEDYLQNPNEIYWVDYVKMHVIEFYEKVLIILMYVFKHNAIRKMIDFKENKLIEHYNQPVLNRRKQIFRLHEVIKDVNKDDLYMVSYKYIDPQMKTISQLESQLEKSKFEKQKLYYDSDNELNAMKTIINEQQDNLYDFKMIITKLSQLYKLNQIKLSDEKVKKEQDDQRKQYERDEFNKNEVERLVKELKNQQLNYSDRINLQIKNN